MTWNLDVDPDVCIGSGVCAALASDRFTLDGVLARPVTSSVEPDETLLDAADTCPAMAITVSERGAVIGPRPWS
ncbi:ferredoxin [Streptomyces sp. Isolate_45]|uniref:ferredoxin n=1 Tax=Streptomyces sp. Isolate_45 TaxID=2950111 RepID=UPI002481E821|nr:ferredoxin [Streptomyces sp. Isolate_45]MDA5285010.1 ferredoxin [Streptomyces sp. Isolate_45]